MDAIPPGCLTGSQGYLNEVTAFYVGLAALEVGDDVRADSTLERATQLAEGEPASWANWGVLALRQGNFDAAGQRLGRAQKLAPQNDQLHYLSGVLERDFHCGVTPPRGRARRARRSRPADRAGQLLARAAEEVLIAYHGAVPIEPVVPPTTQ